MPPKKDDKKKGQPVVAGVAIVTITQDELDEAESLPPLNDVVFTNLMAFKMCRNQTRVQNAIKKLFSYTNPEEPGFSEELANKYKTVTIRQLLG